MPGPLSTAYVDIKPNLAGFTSSLRAQLARAVDGVGQDAGERLGRDFGEGFDSGIEGFGFGGARRRMDDLGGDLGRRLANSFGRAGDDSGRGFLDRLEARLLSFRPIQIPVLGLVAGDVVAAGLSHLISLVGQLGGGAIAMASEVGNAAGALASLGAAASRTASLLATLPTVAASVGLVAGTVELATHGLGKALKAVAEGSDTAAKKLAALPAPARAFAEEVIKLKPRLDELRDVAGRGLFPGVTEGLKSMTVLFPALRTAVDTTARTLGDLARELGALLAGPLGPRLQTVLGAATDIVVIAKGAVGGLVTAFVEVSAAAAPLARTIATDLVAALDALSARVAGVAASSGFVKFLEDSYGASRSLIRIAGNLGVVLAEAFAAAIGPGDRLLDMIEGLTARWRTFASSVEGRNMLREYFDQAAGAGVLLAQVAGNIVASIVNVGKAAEPAGRVLFESLDRATAKFRELSGAADGQSRLQDFFLRLVPAVEEFGRLVADVVVSLANFAAEPGNVALLKQIRTELLPALERMLIIMANEGVFSAFVTFLTAAAQAIGTMAEHSETAVAFLETFTVTLDALNTLLGTPFVASILGVTTALVGMTAALSLIGRLAAGFALHAVAVLRFGAALGFLGGWIGGIGTALRALPALLTRIPWGAVGVNMLRVLRGATLIGIISLGAELIWHFREQIWGGIQKIPELFMLVFRTVVNVVRTEVGNIVGAVTGWIPGAIEAIAGFGSALISSIGDALGTVGKIIGDAWSAISSGTASAVRAIGSAVSSGFSAVVGAVGGALASVWNFVANTWRSVTDLTGRALSGLADAVGRGISNVVSFFAGLPGKIGGALGDLGGLLVRAGRALIEGFISGIKATVGAVVGAVKGVLGKARDVFPFSPAKVGPFSGRGYTLYSGRALMKDFAKGISEGIPFVNGLLNGIEGPALGSGSLASSARMMAPSTTSNTSYNLSLSGQVASWDDPLRQFARMERIGKGRH